MTPSYVYRRGDPSALTPREREVSAMVMGGMTNVEIAESLTVSLKTVEAHVQHIQGKVPELATNRSRGALWREVLGRSL